MAEIVRGEALSKQLANVLRDALDNGDYPVGTLLPSEPALAEKYGLSRPTVRLALATLRAEGRIAVRMGKGSFVRPRAETAVTVDRAHAAERMTPTAEPLTYRRAADDPRLADLLGLNFVDPIFVSDVAAAEIGTGRRILYRSILPFDSTEDTPLATDPFPERSVVLAALAKAHGKLTETEYVRARAPQSDETGMLDLPDGVWVLETTRVISAKKRPLFAEIERTSAEGVQFAYKLS